MKYLAFFSIVLLTQILSAQTMPDANLEKTFVILASEPQYNSAKSKAEKASHDLKLKLDLRGLSPTEKSGLTFDKKICMEGPTQEFPCYNPRGKYDDGAYISIEHSSSYAEMKKGFYIVVAYSGDKKTAEVQLKKIKPLYKEAYLKKVKIFMAGE